MQEDLIFKTKRRTRNRYLREVALRHRLNVSRESARIDHTLVELPVVGLTAENVVSHRSPLQPRLLAQIRDAHVGPEEFVLEGAPGVAQLAEKRQEQRTLAGAHFPRHSDELSL